MAGPDDIAPYKPPAWLRGGHLQTIYAARFIRLPRVNYRRERWTTPDDDFIDVDFVDGDPARPLLILFHGLEGSSASHYCRAILDHVHSLGWTGAVPHFRSCSGELNLTPRFYHSGDFTEIDWITRRMAERFPGRPIYTVGASLGGNALLCWLGESGHAADIVSGAATISAPMCLASGGASLAEKQNAIYSRMFLKTLKTKCREKLAHYPDLFDGTRLDAITNLYDFDNLVTAPLHGFRDTDDYWNRASSRHVLGSITVPTLILNAANDPFLPGRHLPTKASRAVTLEYPDEGGHVGFPTGPLPGNLRWLPRRIVSFLAGQ